MGIASWIVLQNFEGSKSHHAEITGPPQQTLWRPHYSDHQSLMNLFSSFGNQGRILPRRSAPNFLLSSKGKVAGFSLSTRASPFPVFSLLKIPVSAYNWSRMRIIQLESIRECITLNFWSWLWSYPYTQIEWSRVYLYERLSSNLNILA